MTLEAFRQTLKEDNPPFSDTLLQSLWFDAKGDWESAHNLAQDVNAKEGSWIHAYLHRKEGDRANAQYWYHRASQPFPKGSLEEEWEEIARHLLRQPGNPY